MKIGFDIDFTITRGIRYEQVVKKYFPDFNLKEHYTTYPLEESLLMHNFIEKISDFDRHAMYKDNASIIFGQEIIEQEFIILYNNLIKLGAEVYFITARKPEVEKYTIQCFNTYNICTKRLHHLGHYKKQDLINKLNIELFYEDNVLNARSILQNTNCEVRIKEQPYNKSVLSDLQTFSSWREELNYLLTRIKQ